MVSHTFLGDIRIEPIDDISWNEYAALYINKSALEPSFQDPMNRKLLRGCTPLPTECFLFKFQEMDTMLKSGVLPHTLVKEKFVQLGQILS